MLTQEVGTIYCIGRNYSEHAKELNNPVPTSPIAFLKPRSAFVADPAQLKYPSKIARIDPEVELVVQIGRDADTLTEGGALEVISGYSVGLDVTAREEQSLAKQKGLPWLASKGRKSFAPVGTFVPPQQIGHGPFELSLLVNGELRQKGSTEEMLFSIPALLVFLATDYGLRKGDIVFTGTPAGVGPVKAGDHTVAEIRSSKARAKLDIRWL